MSFLYPHAINVSRVVQAFSPTNGAAQETTSIAIGLQASIQMDRDKGTGAPLGFPGATNTPAPMPTWKIYVPGVAQYLIQNGDMVTDATPGAPGQQWRVDAVDWSALGARLFCSPYEPQS